LLWREGFRFNGKKEMIFPAADEGEAPQAEIQDLYEPYYSEEPPVTYDEEWVLSRADKGIRPALESLLSFLEENTPAECALTYRLPFMVMTYRSKRCAFFHVQKKQIRAHISYHGWVPGISVKKPSDQESGKPSEEILERLQAVFAEIDTDLDRV
jgi:hypothetical protein